MAQRGCGLTQARNASGRRRAGMTRCPAVVTVVSKRRLSRAEGECGRERMGRGLGADEGEATGLGSHLNASGECGWSLVYEVCHGPEGESARHDGRDGDDPERHPAAARASGRGRYWRESAVAMPAQGCTG